MHSFDTSAASRAADVTASDALGSHSALAVCLYCGGANLRPWVAGVCDRLEYVAGKWSFLVCRDCSSAVVAPMPKAGELASLYPPVYTFSPELGQESWLRRMLAELEYRFFFRPSYAAQAKIVAGYVRANGSDGHRLLDVGCGRGLRLLEFRRRGFDVHGCDFDEQAVKYLQEQHGIPAAVGDIGRLQESYLAESFDVITAFSVLEHVLDVRALLRACFTILKPGGVLAAAVPLADSSQAITLRGRWVVVREAPRHISLPSRKALRNMCGEVGFDRASMALVADSTATNASLVGMSFSPAGATTHCYGSKRWMAVGARLVGAGISAMSVPWALADKWLLQRPAVGIILARKPGKS